MCEHGISKHIFVQKKKNTKTPNHNIKKIQSQRSLHELDTHHLLSEKIITKDIRYKENEDAITLTVVVKTPVTRDISEGKTVRLKVKQSLFFFSIKSYIIN